MDIFTTENFLNDEDINLTNNLEEKEEPFFDTEGVYKGKITSTQQWINPIGNFAKYIQNKLNAILEMSEEDFTAKSNHKNYLMLYDNKISTIDNIKNKISRYLT